MMTLDAAFVRLQAPTSLAARAMLSFIFIVEGVGKMSAYAEVSDYMRQFGVDPRLLPLVIAIELGGGVLTLVGLATRWAALGLAGFCLLTAWLFHGVGDANQTVQFQKDVAIAGGFLALAVLGPGDWSIEALWRRRATPDAVTSRAR